MADRVSHRDPRRGPEAPETLSQETDNPKRSAACELGRDGWPPGEAKGPVGSPPPSPTADHPPRSTAALARVPHRGSSGRDRSTRRLATIELATLLHGPDAIPPDLPPGPEWCPPWCPTCTTDWWWAA